MARGPHPEDAAAFAPSACGVLVRAAEEVCWLLGRGWSLGTAIQAVGNHHQLVQRQRVALTRGCCAPDTAQGRRARERIEPATPGELWVEPAAPGELWVEPGELWIDGFNAVITVEVALAGGPLVRGVDGVLRDLAGLRGSYRLVEQTARAIDELHRALSSMRPTGVHWLLDRPVSNSGRLREALEARAAREAWTSTFALVADADQELYDKPLVVTGDAVILDRCPAWSNLVSTTVERSIPDAWVVDLLPSGPRA